MNLLRKPNSLSKRPPVIQAIPYRLPLNPRPRAQFLESKHRTFKFVAFCAGVLCRTLTPIISLFFRRSPAAIGRFVVAVIVRVTVQAFTWRAFAHILQEVVKALTPSRANSNAAAAVISEGLVSRIVAACPHLIPTMSRTRSTTLCVPMLLHPERLDDLVQSA